MIMIQFYTTSYSYCVKCGKPLGSIYYTIDDQPWCSECYLRFEKETTPAYSQGWICPRCGRVNSPYVNQCPCSIDCRIKITYQ